MNISLLDSNSFNSPSNTPLDRINSLLLGKCTPSAAPSITKTQTGKDESYGCAFGQRIVDDSWVEISMNSDLKPTDDGHKESESIRQVNLLLNGSRELIEGRLSSCIVFVFFATEAQDELDVQIYMLLLLFYPSSSLGWRYGANSNPGSRHQPN